MNDEMPIQDGEAPDNLPADLEELRRRHQRLDREIAEEEQHPGFDSLRVRAMKRQKLRLREAIVAAERQAQPS